MKISVLIAANQSASQIGDALASVRAQYHTNWEIFVVQYGPSDGTQALVQTFGVTAGRPVTHITMTATGGLVGVRNRLLELASGEYLAFLDPADRWTPFHLADTAARLVAGVDIVSSNVRVERALHPTLEIGPSLHLVANPTRTLFVSDAIPHISAVVFRRDTAVIGGFFDPQFLTAESRDFWLRRAMSGARFEVTHRPTCRCLQPAEPAPGLTLLNAEQRLRFYEKHRDLHAIPAALRRHLLSASLVNKGRLLRVSDPVEAAECFRHAWSLQPMRIQTLGQLALTGRRPFATSLKGKERFAGENKAQPQLGS